MVICAVAGLGVVVLKLKIGECHVDSIAPRGLDGPGAVPIVRIGLREVWTLNHSGMARQLKL